MRADSLSPGTDGAVDGRLPLVHALAAGLLIGAVGGFGTLQVWVLALAGALASHSIARRDGSEPAAVDRVATLLKLAFVLVLCAAAFDNRARPIDVLDPSPAALAAFALIAAGLWLRRRALAALGPHFSIKVVLRDDHRLIESGPYRTIRHPNYAGLVLVMLGTAVVLQSRSRSPRSSWSGSRCCCCASDRRRRAAAPSRRAHARYAARTWRLCPGVF